MSTSTIDLELAYNVKSAVQFCSYTVRRSAF